MPTSVTDDILVSALPNYEERHSSPLNQEYIFSYKIEIHNSGSSPVQLLSRHWYIFDSNGHYSEVKGEGVIGQQPIIEAGSSHAYESYSSLKSDIGMMWGTYLMKRIENGKLFEVKIPEFNLMTPFKLN